MNRWMGEKDDFRIARCSIQVFALLIFQDVFSLQRVVLADSLHLSSEYLAKSNASRRRTRWPVGHRSEEICAFSTVSFDKTSARPSHPVQVLVLPPDDILRRLKKPEFYLWTLITIQVEMAPLITESRSDYQHTSILTHSNSTTTTIRQETPDFVLQRPRKKLWLLISQDVYVDRHCHACENFFRIRKCLHHRQRSRQSIKKKASILNGSDRKWEAMSEREIRKGETPFGVVRLLFLI